MAGSSDGLVIFARGLDLVGLSAERMAGRLARSASIAAGAQQAVADAASKIASDVSRASMEIRSARSLWGASGVGDSTDRTLIELNDAAANRIATGGL
jgi:hypothetical protein